MKELFRKIQPYSGKIFAIGLVLSISREIRNEEDSKKKVNNK